MIGAIQRYRANSGAKPLQVQTNAQPRDGAASGAQDDAPDTAKSPSSNVSAGE
jgi:hypothetical protein